MTSINERRLQGWRNSRDDYEMSAYTVVQWLRQNGHKRFKQQVYEPPFLSIGVKDKSTAKQVETVFRKGDLLVFPPIGLKLTRPLLASREMIITFFAGWL